MESRHLSHAHFLPSWVSSSAALWYRSHGHRQSQNHAACLAAVFHFLSHPFLLQSGRSSFSQEGLHHHLVLRASSQASSSSSHSWAHAPDGSSASRRDRSLCIRTCTSPNIGQVLRFLLPGRLPPKTENSQEQVLQWFSSGFFATNAANIDVFFLSSFPRACVVATCVVACQYAVLNAIGIWRLGGNTQSVENRTTCVALVAQGLDTICEQRGGP